MQSHSKLPRAFREVMTKRTIEDLRIKMKRVNEMPPNDYVQFFFDLCDAGIQLYIETELKRFPNKTPKQIMRDYYKQKDKTRGRRCF